MNVTLTELLERLREVTSLGLRVAVPATVVKYDAEKQRADVTIAFLPVVKVQGKEIPEKPLPLPSVPVAWPRTSAGYLTFPLVAGDTGLVVFCDRSLDQWKSQGKPDDPKMSRTHDLSDGIFLPGAHHDLNPITPATDLGATVLHGDSSILLGRSATSFLAKADLVLSELQSIVTQFNTHTHPHPQGPTSPPTAPMTNPGSVATTKTKGE